MVFLPKNKVTWNDDQVQVQLQFENRSAPASIEFSNRHCSNCSPHGTIKIEQLFTFLIETKTNVGTQTDHSLNDH